MLDPSFFNQWHEKRTSLFVGCQSESLQRIAVSMAADGGFGGDYNGRATLANFGCHGRAGLDYSDDSYMRGVPNKRKCERGRGVAGNDQQVDILRFEKTSGADCVTRDGFRRFGAIRQASRVAEVEVARGQLLGHGLQHGEAADARIENANAR